jgi:hypothetical protein
VSPWSRVARNGGHGDTHDKDFDGYVDGGPTRYMWMGEGGGGGIGRRFWGVQEAAKSSGLRATRQPTAETHLSKRPPCKHPYTSTEPLLSGLPRFEGFAVLYVVFCATIPDGFQRQDEEGGRSTGTKM